jgi:hypothetical protein
LFNGTVASISSNELKLDFEITFPLLEIINENPCTVDLITGFANVLHKTGVLEKFNHCNVQKNHVATQIKEYSNDSVVFKCFVMKNRGTNAINIKKKKESHIKGIAKNKPFILETISNRNTLYALIIYPINIDMRL